MSETLPNTSWKVLSKTLRTWRVQTVSVTMRGHFREPQTQRKAWDMYPEGQSTRHGLSGLSWETWAGPEEGPKAAPPLGWEESRTFITVDRHIKARKGNPSSYKPGANQDPHMASTAHGGAQEA